MSLTVKDLLEAERNTDTFPPTHEEFVAMREKRRLEFEQRDAYAQSAMDAATRRSLFPEYENAMDSRRAYSNLTGAYAEQNARVYGQDGAYEQNVQGGLAYGENYPNSYVNMSNYANTGSYANPRTVSEPTRREYDGVQNGYADPFTQEQRTARSFYDFAAHDNSRLSEEELAAKLSYTNDGARPLFDRNSSMAYDERPALADGTDSRQKIRGRLTTAGKFIVGGFVAAVIVAVSLIFAFGGKINGGTAVVPSSNVTEIATQAI